MAQKNVMDGITKGVNAILEKEKPQELVFGVEALIGLLRNVNQANNVDVELFFKDPKKLANKLKRMEAHGLKYEHVKKHCEELKEVVDKFD